MAAKYDRKTFEHPLLYVTEGPADEAFVRGALKSKGRTSGFHIRNNTDREAGARGGIEFFGETLRAIRSFTGFEVITHAVLVIDNDADPQGNFGKVRDQIAAIPSGARNYAIPTKPHMRSRESSKEIDVTVISIPWDGVKGNLETLCLPAAREACRDIEPYAQTYLGAAGVPSWRLHTKRDISLIRCLFAAFHEKNPAIGIGKIWDEAPNLIPITHHSLRDIVALLNGQTA